MDKFLITGLMFFIININNGYGQAWQSIIDSATVFKNKKITDSALFYYEKARVLLENDTALQKPYEQLCRDMGDLYFTTGQFYKAAPFYEASGVIREKHFGKMDSLYLVNLGQLGIVFFRTGTYDKSEYFFESARALKAAAYTKNTSVYAVSCTNLANVYATTGKYNQAEKLYFEAKAIIEKINGKESRENAQCCNGLASLYTSMGLYETAEPIAVEAKEIRSRIYKTDEKYGPVYALSCLTLANLYRALGQYEKAEMLYLEAKQIRATTLTKLHPLYAASCNILADLYYYKKEFKKAEALYQEAKEIRSVDKNKIPYAESCNNLAALYIETGQVEKAEMLAVEAKNIWEQQLPPGDPTLPLNYNNLGNIYFALGKWQTAVLYFNKARALWAVSPGKEHPFFSQNTNSLAKVYWNLQQQQQADALYRQTLQSQYNQVKKVFQFTNEAEKQSYLNNISLSANEYRSFRFKNFSHTDAGELYNDALSGRQLILSSQQQLRRIVFGGNDTAAQRQYRQWTTLKEQLANLYVKSYVNQKEKIKILQEKADLLEKAISRRSAQFTAARNNSINWKNIQQQLKPGEAAIEFIEFPFYNGQRWTDSVLYAALLLRNDGYTPGFIYLFEKKELDSLLHPSGGAASGNITSLYTRGASTENVLQGSSSLYQLVWKPLDKYLTGIKKIFFAPAGLLHRLSFAALPVGDHQLLIDKYRLVQLNSTASVVHIKNTGIAKPGKLIAYGGIDYNANPPAVRRPATVMNGADSLRADGGETIEKITANWPLLPGTLKEIITIKKMAMAGKFDCITEEGAMATEHTIKNLSGANAPQVLHIASHGFFYPDPDRRVTMNNKIHSDDGSFFKQAENPLFRSGLVFAGANNSRADDAGNDAEDGILTAYEVADLYLQNTKLVVLSACETGLGEIAGSEGVYGLQRAFKMAGAQNLVMSLWQVPDEETAAFMQEFYRQLFNRLPIGDAFHKAQLVMKNKYSGNPYKWAAWILIQ